MISGIIGTIAGLYFLVLIVNFILKLVVKDEQPWMKVLDQICEPAVGFDDFNATRCDRIWTDSGCTGLPGDL